MYIDKLKFDDRGLIPAIIQDYTTREVLMLAYMNRESLEKTLESGYTWFYSRSRGRLWNKGETSGCRQKVQRIEYDCDEDTLLILVLQEGSGACHTGSYSCFFRTLYSSDGDNAAEADIGKVLQKLYKVIEDRKASPVEGSYTNYLLREGIDKILKKVGEESTEVIIAAKGGDEGQSVYEMADLLYHLEVLMVESGIRLDSIAGELQGRFK